MLIYNCFYQRQTRQKVYLKLLQLLFNTPQYRLHQNLPHLQQLRFLQGAISVLPQQVAGWLTCQSLRTFYQTQVRLTNSSVYYSIFLIGSHRFFSLPERRKGKRVFLNCLILFLSYQALRVLKINSTGCLRKTHLKSEENMIKVLKLEENPHLYKILLEMNSPRSVVNKYYELRLNR